MIRRSLETVGRAADTELTAFTDGAPNLRSILSEASCKKPPIADLFYIAMRLQHTKQAASGLSTETPGRMQAKGICCKVWQPSRSLTHFPCNDGILRNAFAKLASNWD
jgi:hypothetical protein